MDYMVSIFKKNTDKVLFEGKANQDGLLEILKRFSSLNGHQKANFMHDLRETGSSHVLESNKLPYEIVAVAE